MVEVIIRSLLVIHGRELIRVRKSDDLVLHVYEVSCCFGATGKGGKTGYSLSSLFSKVGFFELEAQPFVMVKGLDYWPIPRHWLGDGGLAGTSGYLEPRSPMH